MSQNKNKPILITTGEPAGIGMDIVLSLAKTGYFKQLRQPIIVVANVQALIARLKQLQQNHWHHDLKQPSWCVLQSVNNLTQNEYEQKVDFYLIDIPVAEPVIAGQINVNNASMVLAQLALAHDLANLGKIAAIVTAPLQKSALINANLNLPDGSIFSGHTEYFMQMSGCKKVVMMLANSKLKVALVTTHLPLSQVANAITKEQIQQTVEIVLNSLHNQFGINHPKVLVCGLNPHAGEGGHLGIEEIETINPVLQTFIEAGHDISLAMPADTLFTERYLANCDATIAMYHDQGLPVLKSHGFGDSVNITLGLPYVRTSVDHGTALDLAGTGKASSNSLKQAIVYAIKMTNEPS